jgi:hypothetical protein
MEQVDPEEEADFEREYAKMMAESLESRKFDRKPLFDVPLPVRSKARDTSTATDSEEKTAESAANTMAFSLLTKKGNRQQVSPPRTDLRCGRTIANMYRPVRLHYRLTRPLLSP